MAKNDSNLSKIDVNTTPRRTYEDFQYLFFKNIDVPVKK